MTPHYLYRLRIHKLVSDINRALEGCEPEAIHDARVSIRRMVMLCAVLKRSGKEPYAQNDLRILKGKFRKAGALRDLQVLHQLLTGWEDKLQIHFDLYRKYLDRRKKTLQKHFIRAFQTINLRKTIPDNVNNFTFRRDIEKELRRLDDDFRHKLQATDSLHQLRITAKKLKYTLEIQQACYPGFGSTETFRKYLAHVQDLLGLWHDIETSLYNCGYFIRRNKVKLETPYIYEELICLMEKEKEMALVELHAELKKNIPLIETLSVVLS